MAAASGSRKGVAEVQRPGANTLRGGSNTYTAKTLVTEWVEDRYDPRFEGVKKHAETESIARGLEATGGRVPSFGTGLAGREGKKFDDRIDYSNVVTYDKDATAAEWESVTHSAHRGPEEGKSLEFRTTFRSLPHELNSNPSSTEEYRKRWLLSDKGGASRRFVTENTLSQATAVDKKYRPRMTRTRPGVPKCVEVFRQKIIERGGLLGIRTIGRMFRVMDDSGNKQLSKSELRYGLVDYGLSFSVDEFEALWRFLDRDGSSSVDYDEFLRGVRGDMNDRRVGMVRMAWEVLDKTGDDRVTVDDLKGTYDPSFHPDVESGKITPDEALSQFLSQWDTDKKDGIVSFDEFLEYYNDVSASIDDDDYFELMMRNAWHLAGGEGWCENTTCLRVLVTHADGSKTIESVPNDLGLKAGDTDGIKSRLAKAGMTDVVEVSTHF